MKRRPGVGATGLEGAPDIMLLTMAGLMVAIVWLATHAHERTLPPIELPTSEAAGLGLAEATPLHVTLRPGADRVEIWVEDRRLAGGLPELERALRQSGAGAMTLRADAGTRWQAVLDVMSTAARLDWSVNVAAER